MGTLHDMQEALEIFEKYTDEEYVFYTQHDTIGVGVSPSKVSDEDKERLDELGFYPDEGLDSFEFFV